MQSVKGIFQNGLAKPLEPIQGRNGQAVIITFVEADNPPEPMDDSSWDDLEQILKECQVETGITDLAHQHDHYIHGTPKFANYLGQTNLVGRGLDTL